MNKKIFFLMFAFLQISQLCFSQGYDPNSKYSFGDTGMKPDKKTPEMPRSFEVIQGSQIKSLPINMTKFQSAVNLSIQYLMSQNTKYAVTTHQEGTGFIFIRVRRTPAWVDIKICYWEDEYWYEYWDSYNFGLFRLYSGRKEAQFTKMK